MAIQSLATKNMAPSKTHAILLYQLLHSWSSTLTRRNCWGLTHWDKQSEVSKLPWKHCFGSALKRTIPQMQMQNPRHLGHWKTVVFIGKAAWQSQSLATNMAPSKTHAILLYQLLHSWSSTLTRRNCWGLTHWDKQSEVPKLPWKHCFVSALKRTITNANAKSPTSRSLKKGCIYWQGCMAIQSLATKNMAPSKTHAILLYQLLHS